MPTKSYSIRLQAEGGAEIKRAFAEAGQAGQAAFDGVGTAADQAGAATDRLAQKTHEAANAARQAQAAASSGAAQTTPAAPRSSAPGTNPSPGVAREVEALRRRLDEEYRTARQRDRDEGIINRGVSSGAFDDAYAQRLRGLSSSKYGNDNDPTRRGLSSYDKSFIKYQGFDVAASLGSGASPITTALQQGPQVLQQLADREGGLGAGLKQLAVSATALVTPFTLAATATVGVVAAMAYAAKSAGDDRAALERATQGLGRATGATSSDLDRLARSNAEAGKVSVGTARDITIAYASTGQISLPIIGDLTRVTSDYARLIGSDVPTATAQLAAALSDPARGAEDLAAKIGGLDDKTKQLIQRQIEAGDRSGAQQTAFTYLKTTVEANTSATEGWAGAWSVATTAISNYLERAKQVAGIKLGVIPEGLQDAVDRTKQEVDNVNRTRAGIGMEPLGLGDSAIRDRDVAALNLDTKRRQAEAAAAEEAARLAAIKSGSIALASDPNYARLSELRKQQTDLADSLSSPLGRAALADVKKTEDAYFGVFRAIETLTDANGKLISSEEMARQQDQLRIDSIKAKTDAEKASVAERQKAFDLIGKTVTGRDASSQIERAGQISRLEAQSKGGGGSDADKKDDYDRALRSIQDRTRRQGEEAETYGMGAEAVARYRTEIELKTAAERAGRAVTPALADDIRRVADQSAEAAKRVEDLRESSRRTDEIRGIGSDGVRTLVRDLSEGANRGKILDDVLGNLKSRLADLASTSISDSIFGKRGSSDGGLIASLFSGGSGASGGGLVTGIKSLFGFDRGGWTGPGDRFKPAGIVHAEEVVWSRDDIRRAGGVSVVEGMRLGARGYAGGGYVSPYTVPSRAAVAPSAANTRQGPPMVNVINNGEPVQARVEQRQDGSMDVILDKIEGRTASRISSRRSPINGALAAATSLRG